LAKDPAIQDPKSPATSQSAVIPASVATETPATPTKPSDSNWSAFDKAKLVPSEIVCQGYYPVHPHDASCHSRLKLSAESMMPHVEGEHGNKYGVGFRFSLRQSDGKVWKGFDDLHKKGVEITDIRCDVCDEVMRLQSQVILKHMKPHSGKTRRTRTGGIFWMTLSTTKVEPLDEENSFFDQE
jgi:hypothetical protein